MLYRFIKLPKPSAWAAASGFWEVNPELQATLGCVDGLRQPWLAQHYSAMKKRSRLLMFLFILHLQQLNNAQCAQLHIKWKALLQCLKQLKIHSKLLLEQPMMELEHLQLKFIHLAQQVHHLWVSVNYNEIGPHCLMDTHTVGLGKGFC